jgi:hypothetical protein
MNYFVVEGLQGSQSIIGNLNGPPNSPRETLENRRRIEAAELAS